ncbi:DUF6083 domain-containing protein [Streptomyces sp. CoH27]|uniref:DUF6083 domain-containing protein n=1 Tax=Streptomyces sp. CoH27 TaxID=2875763 RepID=UPI0027E14DF4|nr:DUF6083 domain-containing protein [Streptomyces sp. CoH27]
MGATRDGDQSTCLRCGETGGSVRERGRIGLTARYCGKCWNILANEMAEADGATAAPGPEPDPDDVAWIEPPVCPECGASIRVYPTNYDRWVSLAMVELPAKDVPEAFRWRLTRLPTRSLVPADIVAVRVRGIDPLPGEPVVPAHRMMCVPEWGEP